MTDDMSYTFTINPGDFIPGDYVCFTNGGKEMLRLAGNGDIYVRGELMETNRDVVDGLKRMLGIAPVKTLSGDIEGDYPRLPHFTVPKLPKMTFDAIACGPKPIGTPVLTQIDTARTGANCSVCHTHNEYQTTPYTCYQCRNGS